ncbi:MAG: hypothetical protein ACK5FD_08155 [Bacteroidota bacterium]|jgi:hypothetical protein
MKKIRRIEDIEHAKLKLRVQQLDQEKEIRAAWKELKYSFSPGALLQNKISHWAQVGWRLLSRKWRDSTS